MCPPASGLLQIGHKLKKMTMTSQFFDMTSPSVFFDVLFLLWNLVTGPSLMSISSMVLELWQFSFIRHLTRNLEFENTCIWVLPNSWRLGKLGIPNLITYYWMLQNARVTAFTFSELLRENQQGEGGGLPPTQIRVNQSLW